MSETHYSLEAQSTDWVVIITALLKRHAGNTKTVGIGSEEGHVIYQIPREAIPPEAVAAALGTTVDNVKGKTGRIILRPFKQMATWPKPTVEYHGNA